MSSATRYRIFVSVAPGLEALLQQELEALGLPDARAAGRGGVELRGDNRDLWRVLLCSRLAETARVRLGQPFKATRFEQLQRRAERLPWAAFFVRGAPLPRIRATCRGSRLYHSGAVELGIADMLRRRLNAAGEVFDEDLPTVHARVVDDQVQLSVDASGERLHRRGYRTHVGDAPLRETLAAACLRAAGHDGSRPLWDPFCGSGTICIEAAGMAAGCAPRLSRRFALERWPTHDGEGFARFKASLEPERSLTSQPIVGSDVDLRAVAAAQHNAAAAGLEADLRFYSADIEAHADAVGQGSWIVTNPPFGRRLEGSAPHCSLGAVLRRRPDLRPAFALMARSRVAAFVEQTGLPWEPVLAFTEGGLAVQLLQVGSTG